MPDLALTVINFYQGQKGTCSGTDIFTDLGANFQNDVVGTNLTIAGVSYLVTQRLNATSISVQGSLPVGSDLAWSVEVPAISGQAFNVMENPTYGYVLAVRAVATENAFGKNVKCILDMGDGSPALNQTGSETVSIENSVRFRPGVYRIRATATNFKYPTPQSKIVYIDLTVGSELAVQNPNKFVIAGPILPRDGAYPDAQSWNLDLAVDDIVLESNVKSIVSTQVGERLMNPTFGTALDQSIFENNDPSVQQYVSGQVTAALQTFEPRVRVLSVLFTFDSAKRTGTLNVQTQSLISNSVLTSNVNLNG